MNTLHETMPLLGTLCLLYTGCALLLACLLAGAAIGGTLRRRGHAERDALLRAHYLHTLMMTLSGELREVPRFPQLDRRGSRRILCETVAGVVAITYGLDGEVLRRIVDRGALDRWLLRRCRRSHGYRRARNLALLAALPGDGLRAEAVAPYLRSRNRYVRFYALTVQLTADPAHAVQHIGAYPEPLSAVEVAELVALLRRGILPLAYGPLLEARRLNLRRVGLAIVRQFGVEEAEGRLLQFLADTSQPELGREALYALCALRRPLLRREVALSITGMNARERQALLRRMAFEGYAPATMQRLFDEAERPYYERLIRSYKRSLA